MILLYIFLGFVAAIATFWLVAPRQLTRLAMRLLLPFFRVQVIGAEHLHTKGPTVYIANHTSLMDGPLLVALIGRDLNLVVHTLWAQSRLLKFFSRAFRIAAIDPQRPMSAKWIARRVAEGEACLIFPEGRISVTGAPMKINPGAAWLVDAARADIVAIHIDGLQQSMFARDGTGWRRMWRPRVRVTVSPAQRLEVDGELRGKLRREKVNAELRDIIEMARFEALNRHQNLVDGFLDALKAHGAARVLYEDVLGQTMDYGTLRLGASVLEQIFRKHFAAGDTTGFLLPTAPAAMAALMGLWRAGVTPAILNHTVGAAAVANNMRVVKARKIVSSRAFVEKGKLTALVQELEAAGISFIWLEDERAALRFGTKIKGLLGKGHMPRGIDRDTPAAILFTSGTEGSPKGVVLTHGNILSNISQIRARANISPRDVSLSALPVFHSFGLTAGMILPLICGIRTGLHPSPLHYRIIPELAYSMQATLLFGTDTFLNGWARRAGPDDFASLRAVVAGAEAVKDSTRKLWAERFGVRVLEGFGATECSPVLSLNTPSEPDLGTVGRLLPGMKMRLEEVPGITGKRLHVWGPNVMAGYLLADAPGQIQPPAGGWYDTGDAVTVDDKGLIRIVGRIKRFAKVGGEMVSLQSVETLAQGLWSGAQNAAINVAHPKTGEQVVLYTTEPQAERAALLAHGKASGVGAILLPAQVIQMDNIPLLASGKVDYPALMRLWKEQNA